MAFFRKTSQVLNLFLNVLENVIDFCMDSETEASYLLVKVLHNIGTIAITANEMDTKTFVEMSKTFRKMVLNPSNSTKRDILSSTVGSFIEDLSNAAVHALSKLLDQNFSQPVKIDDKFIKCWAFQLNIVGQLCTVYYEYLKDETVRSIMRLFIQLHKCSSAYLTSLGLKDEQAVNTISTYIFVAAESMLSSVLKNFYFKKIYFEYQFETNADMIAYFLLTLDILKNLTSMVYHKALEWLFDYNCILDATLTFINNLNEEILSGGLRMKAIDAFGERARLGSIYEATLVSMCSLICQIESKDFKFVELLLVKHLMSNKFWASLLSADLWCFVDRLASTEVCYEHLKFLFKFYSLIFHKRTSLDVIMMENLIGRLYMFLPLVEQVRLVEELTSIENDTLLFDPFLKLFPSKANEILYTRLKPEIKEIAIALRSLNESPSIKTWHQLVSSIIANSLLPDKSVMKDSSDLLQLWTFSKNTIDSCDGKLLAILIDFLTVLLHYSQPNTKQGNEMFASIVRILTELSLSMPSSMRLEISYYFQESVELFDNCGENTADALAELSSTLMCDENILVHQAMLESFDFVARMCPNDHLLARMAVAISNKSHIIDVVQAYLSKTPCNKNSNDDSQNYMHRLAKIFPLAQLDHQCYFNDGYEKYEKQAKLEQLPYPKDSDTTTPLLSSNTSLTSNQLDQRISIICDEIKEILRHRGLISQCALQKLRNILQVIDAATR
ncbi:FIGNL1-interacting regulator of recombination and mitosis-like isoform X2 [Prorops nasuta]